MSKSIVFKLKFISLLNQPFPNLYHEIRELGQVISANTSNAQGLGTPISRPPGTILVVHIRHPLTKKMIVIKELIKVPDKKGTYTIKAPFSLQVLKLRQLSEGGSTLRKTYKVSAGDSLYSIAKKFGTTWQILFELNKNQIKKPDNISPGQWIKVPPKGSSLTGTTNNKPKSLGQQTHYKVKKGETLSGISERSGVSTAELQRINGISDPTSLQAGQTIKLRGSAPSASQTSSTPTPTAQPTPSDEGGFLGNIADGITAAGQGIAEGVTSFGQSVTNGISSIGQDLKEGWEDFSDAVSGTKDGESADSPRPLANQSNSAGGNQTYTIKSGDTLGKIAQQHGVRTNDLANANGLSLTDTIHPGDQLTIPSGGLSSSSSTNSNSSSQSNRQNEPIQVTTVSGNSASNGSPREVATTDGSCVCQTHDLIWGAKVSCEFRKKVVEISQDLWPDDYLAMANNLMAVFAWESGGTFKADAPNQGNSGGTGLIQFMPDTYEGLTGEKATMETVKSYWGRNKTLKRVKQLAEMDEIEQLDLVQKYFAPKRNQKLEFIDFYLQVLFPVSSGKPEHVVFADSINKLDRKNESSKLQNLRVKAYPQNKIDPNQDGKVMKSEIAKAVNHYLTDGLKHKNFKSTCSQAVQPPATNNETSSLIDRAKAGKRYVKIPNNYWILGERANINRPNKFDDMIHLMLGEKLIKSVKGTTHPGVQSLTNPDAYNSARTGSPVWDFGWHYGVWSKGRHRGRIDAFAHTGVAYINRDTNRNNMPDNFGASRPETGKGLNFHPASYTPTGSSSTIGTWSTGCVVVQSATDYYQIFNTIIKSGQNKLTFCVVAGDI